MKGRPVTAGFRAVVKSPLGRELSRRSEAKKQSTSPLPSDSPEVVALLGSTEFATQVQDLASKLSRPVEQVLREAGGHLREMAAVHSDAVTEPWHRFGRWMLRGYDILLDEESLAQLRALDREHSLVFLISHRSYLDEWAVPPSLVDLGIQAPFGFAGANLDFFPLGTVARRTGIVHIRRTTAGVPVYKFALRMFMRQLIATRANLIWSIEGGRSRTGKLRPPRFGLLRYVVDAVEELGGSEVLLVPVSILYDQLPTHEVDLMTSEARGQGKRPEDMKWFVEYLRGLRHRRGRIYVDFGEPLALGARLAELESDGSQDAHVVERIAVEVSHRINMATPVTPTAAVCIALLAADKALTLDEILETVQPLAGYLRSRKWPTAGAANLTDRATARRALQELVASGVLTSFQGETTVWGIGASQHLVAAVYRNSAIHVLVQRAILELVLTRLADDTEGKFDPLEHALRLRDLLKFDFFFAGREQFAKDMQFELDLFGGAPGYSFAELEPEQAGSLIAGESRFVADLTLRPFFDAYAIVANQLVEHGDSPRIDEERFLSRCLVIGQQWSLQRRIASEESASVEMFQTGLRLAGHLGLVDTDEPGIAARRRSFELEIDDVRRRMDGVARRPSPVQ
jgi:glycerol-3-phosphate O-acyltransferase